MSVTMRLLLTFQSINVCPQLSHNKEDNYLVSQVKKRKKKKKKRERELIEQPA